MLNSKNPIVLFKQINMFARDYCQKKGGDFSRKLWFGFMCMLTLAAFIIAWSGLNILTGMSLLVLMIILGWTARQWLAMQNSVVMVVLLLVVAILTKTTSLLMGFMLPIMSLLLLACLSVAVMLDLDKKGFAKKHVSYLAWSVIVSGVLLVMLRWPARQSAGVYYASLPLSSVDDFLILSVSVMVFLYLLFQRTHARIHGSFLGLVPAVVMGFYLAVNTPSHDIPQQILPDAVLEHGLLLIHVPAMLIAFALMVNGVGFALLRLLTDTAWLRARQNMDILETVQTGLEDYLYRMLALAIVLMGVGLLTGMIWSSLVWGHYWYSDAKQSLSLAVWLYYLAGLHLRMQRGMQMRPFAWWCLAGLPLLLMSFIGTNWWSQGLHSFGSV